MFLYSFYNQSSFKGLDTTHYNPKISKGDSFKLPIPDELHEYIFSFLDEESQQRSLLVNKFWSKVCIQSATSSQIEKIQNFIDQLISILDFNLDSQNFEIKEKLELFYLQNKEELLALRSELPPKFNCSSLSTFKISLLPIKELMIWNLRQMTHAISSDSVKASFKLLIIEEPPLLKNFFYLAWLDFKYDWSWEKFLLSPERGETNRLLIFWKLSKLKQFDRMIKIVIKIKDDNDRLEYSSSVVWDLFSEKLYMKALDFHHAMLKYGTETCFLEECKKYNKKFYRYLIKNKLIN